MLSVERIPVVLIDGKKSDREDFRTCVAGSRFKVWTDSQYSDHLLPLYRTLSPSLAVIDIDASPKVKGGPTAMQAIQDLLKEIPTARIVVSHTLERKFLVGSFFQAGVRGNVMRPYTVDRVLDGIGLAFANRDVYSAKRRTGIRVPARLDFFYKEPTTGKMWAPTRQSQTEDLCETGARVRVDRTFPAGEELKVALRMQPTAPPMWIRARVARCEQVTGEPVYDLGLAFVEMETTHQAAIRDFVRDRVANGQVQ
ncbi:MAG: PilZ domain-containing protein [Planctomycetota bacterium]